MFLFKTSGQTYESVIENAKHAFVNQPQNWSVGEKVLVSKNKKDCKPKEKQISYIMEIQDMRLLTVGEAEKYWKGTEGRWNYLVICNNTKKIPQPFDLKDVIGEESALSYVPVVTFRKLPKVDETEILEYLNQLGMDL